MNETRVVKNIKTNLNIKTNKKKLGILSTQTDEIKITSPNKTFQNRSKSFEFSKLRKSEFINFISTKISSKKTRIHSVDLLREVEDPANQHLKDEIERIIHFYKQIDQIKNDFKLMEK